MKIKNKWHRYDTDRPKSGHGPEYSEYKKCLSMMMIIWVKLHRSNIWNSCKIHVKVKQHRCWVVKKHCL